jgi:hypothetical protein
VLDKVFGVPAHPFFVHAPLVLTPLVAVLALCLVAKPAWRTKYGVPIAILAFVNGILTFLAGQSGESLRATLRGTVSGAKEAAIRNHANLADAIRPVIFLLWLTITVFVAYAYQREGKITVMHRTFRWPGGDSAAKISRVIVAIVAIVATAWMVKIGHEGAKATWMASTPQG